MAFVCVQCVMLHVTILLIISLSSVYSSSDYYLYDTHSLRNLRNVITDLVLQDTSLHVLNKRQTQEELNFTSTNAPETHSATPLSLNVSTTVRSVSVKNDSREDDIVHSIALSPNDTSKHHSVSINETVGNNNNQTEEFDDDLSLSDLSNDTINKTLARNNITKTEYDTHQFYNSTLTDDPDIGHKYWLDMTKCSDVRVNELLSQSHRRAATVRLSFDFPFYGHIVRNITIATGGFLYTGEYVHSWLAATQYIAPLMANFDTSLSNDSLIKYVDNGTAFTVQWEKVTLQEKPSEGDFTFQATLHNNGDIVFVYQQIPIIIEDIQDDHHPVKVGLSDAYISDRKIFFVHRKTIYEYHRVHFNQKDITNWTVIYLSALPTCLSNKDCVSCVSKPTSTFQCYWCPGTNRCSNGMDRHRHDWVTSGCERKKIGNETYCSATETETDLDTINGTDTSSRYDSVIGHQNRDYVDDPRQSPRRTTGSMDADNRMGVSGIVTILFMLCLVIGLAGWLMYAYRNPHTTSGQILIRYRPSQWSWKRGEARYTAATIHM